MILKRSIILIALSITYYILGSLLSSFIIESKEIEISELEQKQKTVNEQFITAQILSQKLDNVYNVFEENLTTSAKDEKNRSFNGIFEILDRYNGKVLYKIKPNNSR